MKKDEVKETLNQVLTWPPERQANVVRMIQLLEEDDDSEVRPADDIDGRDGVVQAGK